MLIFFILLFIYCLLFVVHVLKLNSETQARLTDKVLFPGVVLYFKTFPHIGDHGTESCRDERFYKKSILEHGKLLLEVLLS